MMVSPPVDILEVAQVRLYQARTNMLRLRDSLSWTSIVDLKMASDELRLANQDMGAVSQIVADLRNVC